MNPHRHAQLNALSLPWPADWPALFGAQRPLMLEIGFGSGVFLEALADAHPDHNIVGVEISNQCLLRAERMIARRALDNVRVVHSRAETALAHLFAPQSLSAIYINYPDPWFKRGHHHRRLMQSDTLALIVSRMRPGARLEVATDIEAYAELTDALLSTTPALRNLLPQPAAETLPGRVVTKYEMKARREGRRSWTFAYARTDAPAPPVPLAQELPMPHLVVQLPLTFEQIADRYQPFETRESGIIVGFGELYRGRASLLFEIHAAEPTIDQHTALLLAPHGRAAPPGEYTLQLSALGHPRPTPGIHLAVRALGDWLLHLHPQARRLSGKLAGEPDAADAG